MNRTTTSKIAAALALALALVVGVEAMAQQPVGHRSLKRPRSWNVNGIEVLPVRGNVYMLAGAGANVTIQAGDEGLLLVDTGNAADTAKLLAALREVFPDQPVRTIINTSADADHVGGNGTIVTAFGGPRGMARPGVLPGEVNENLGVQVVAHEEAMKQMSEDTPSRKALPTDALPGSTFFTRRKEFFSNGEAVQIFAQPAHTAGDVLVFFRASEVISAGDTWTPNSYPAIDPARGGSLQGVIDSLNAIIDIAIPERNQMGGTRVISGHGQFGNESDVVEYRDMVTVIRDRIRTLVTEGRTLAQVKAAGATKDYDPVYGTTSGAWTTEMFVEAVYRAVGGK